MTTWRNRYGQPVTALTRTPLPARTPKLAGEIEFVWCRKAGKVVAVRIGEAA